MAQVLENAGEVFVIAESTQGSSTRKPVGTTATMVEAGHTITTGADGTAILSLVPGIGVQLNPNTKIAIDELLMVKTSHITFFVIDSRAARIRLVHGSLYASVQSVIADSELKVEIPAGLLSAPQMTSFYLEAGSERVRVLVSEGVMNIQDKGGQTLRSVPEGFYVDWRAGMPPDQAYPAQANDLATQELLQARDAKRRFSDLLRKASAELPAQPGG